MIALAFAAALSAAPASAPAQAAQAAKPKTSQPAGAPVMDDAMIAEIAYARAALPIAGWQLLSATHDLIVFYKGSVTPAPRLWIRGEHYPLGPDNPIGNGESFVTAYELDCPGGRSRTLSSTVYSGAKMQGEIIAASDKAGEWTLNKPGGFTAMGSDAVCRLSAVATPTPRTADQILSDGKSALQTAAEHKASATTPR